MGGSLIKQSTDNKLKSSLLLLMVIAVIMVAGCSNSDDQAQGYVEGKFTYLASPFSGKLEQLHVRRGTQVHHDQLIFQLDAEPEQSALESAKQKHMEAKAQHEQAQSALWLAEKTLERTQKLYQEKAVQQASVDKAQSQFEQATARVEQTQKAIQASQAAFEQAQWAIQQKTVSAPVDAVVFDTYYQPGEFVPAGRPVASLLPPDEIKIIFFVGEPLLAKLKVGDTITLSCDGCPETNPLSGTVTFISPENEYTPPVIFSMQTRKKLVYRVEAKPSPDNSLALKPGQPVTVHL